MLADSKLNLTVPTANARKMDEDSYFAERGYLFILSCSCYEAQVLVQCRWQACMKRLRRSQLLLNDILLS